MMHVYANNYFNGNYYKYVHMSVCEPAKISISLNAFAIQVHTYVQANFLERISSAITRHLPPNQSRSHVNKQFT